MFKEDCTKKIKSIMKEKCDTLRQKYQTDTVYNKCAHERLDRIENSFPGKTWFLSKKPPQTKVNHEHSTGLCKDCHAAQVNHDTLLKQARMMCECGTDKCENWFCYCEDQECSCDLICRCDRCIACEVIIYIFL